MAESFDPDSYLAAKESNSIAAPTSPVPVDQIQLNQFDPDTYLSQKANVDYNKLQMQHGGLGNEILAGTAGLARGATLGGSDIALTKSGLVSPETLKGLSEANPLSSGAGQLVGGAGLIGATGGLGAGLEGMGAAEQIAAMGVEGGLFGAGNAATEYAMGDPTLNAQKIASHIGTGVLFGTALSSLGKIAQSILPKATEALNSSLEKIKGMGEPSANTELPPMSGATTDIGVPASLTNWADKLNFGLKNGVQDTKIKAGELVSNLQDLHDSAKTAAKALYEEAAPANIGKALEDMPLDIAKENALGTLNKVKRVINGTEDITGYEVQNLSSDSSRNIVNNSIDKLEGDLFKAKTSYDIQKSLSDFAKDIDQRKIIKFDTLPTAANQSDQEVLLNMRNAIRGDLKNPELWGEAATHYSELSDNYSAYKNALKNFQSSFMRREISPSGAKRYVIDPGKVSSFFNKYDNMNQDLKKQYLNQFIDQTNNLGKASENYHGFVNGADSISSHIGQLSKQNQELAQLAQAMSKKSSPSSGVIFPSIIANTLGIPKPLIGAVAGMVKAVQSITNPYEMGANLGQIFSTLKAVGSTLEKATKSINTGAAAIFNNNTARSISSGLTGISEKEYNKRADRIQQLAENPDELIKHMEKTTSALHEAAPGISTGLHTTITNGIQFLNSKVPRPKNNLLFNNGWKPTPSQKARFNKYFGAVNEPTAVLKQIKDGTLSNEAMEALNAVHPELLSEMRQKVAEHLIPDKIQSLNYATKISLSKFLGQPLESAMLPQVMAANQATFILPSANSQQGKQKMSKTSTEKMNIGNRYLTETQDLEKSEA